MVHAFAFQNEYYALDVESGALHALDKPAYDVVRALENGSDPGALPYDKKEIDEILAELDELKAQGAFSSPAPEIPEGIAQGKVVKAMCLHIAHDCNLRCKYCFAGTGEFHGERMLMRAETGKRALDFLVARSGNRRHLEVDLFGGEPLMNFPAVKEIVSYGRALEKKHGKEISFTITTNGVALTGEIIDYLNAEMHNVVLSLDGRKAVHDALRPTPNGKGSYETIVENAKKLVGRRGDKEYYIRGTFTSQNLDFTEDVKHMAELGFDRVSIEPVVLPDSSPYALRDADLTRILGEYDALASYLWTREKSGKHITFFHFMIDLGNGPCLKKRISGCGAGSEYVAVTPEGDLYPCHQFVGEEGYKMGSVLTGEFDAEMQARFSDCNILTKEACRACWAKYFCAGGCAANAYKYNGSIYEPHQMTCAFEKKRAEVAMGLYARRKQM
ncbi:MAG: thioether cross-link-forming SCIFF peptide maturase [Eubacteriales bacterium]|nr:thioether cross-link-forming SCIFF peptide maturase [Eubacteriales bacterium]